MFEKKAHSYISTQLELPDKNQQLETKVGVCITFQKANLFFIHILTYLHINAKLYYLIKRIPNKQSKDDLFTLQNDAKI